MGEPVGLAAYRAKTAQAKVDEQASLQPRPDGELIWIHAAEPGSVRVATDLVHEVMRRRQDCAVLMTTDTPEIVPVWPGFLACPPPLEHPGVTAAFMRHWRPDMGIWLWGGLRPNLILSAAVLECPLILADASQSGFDIASEGWLAEIPLSLLPHFSHWLTRSEAGKHRLAQYGVPLDRIEQIQPLRAVGHTLPAAESDLDELRQSIGGRPVWFARNVAMNELETIIAAHRTTMGLAPRLVLVLEPAHEEDAPAIAERLTGAAMHVTRWSDGGAPTESTQVLLADLPDEAGLWYRLSSVAFLGHTLVDEPGSVDPFEAAAHGSVVLFGPHLGPHKTAAERLTNAGAARLISDAPSLSAAIARLIEPDQAATMAMAAWDLVTEGTVPMSRIIDLVSDRLDQGAK